MFKIFKVHCTDGTYFLRTSLPLTLNASEAVYSFQMLVRIYQIASVVSQKAISFIWWDAAIYSVLYVLLLNVRWRADVICILISNVHVVYGVFKCWHQWAVLLSLHSISVTRWSVVVQPSQPPSINLCHFCKDVTKCMYSITFLVCSHPLLYMKYLKIYRNRFIMLYSICLKNFAALNL
jgi:hypothetical protein